MTIGYFALAALAASLAGAASGQVRETVSDWAVPVGMGSGQAQAVLEMLNASVSSRPFSATGVVHMVHTLEDGTHIDETTTTVMYRDAQGRTRSETGDIIDVADPVARVGLRLQTETGVATQRVIVSLVVNGDQPARLESLSAMKRKNDKRSAQPGPNSTQPSQAAEKKREQRATEDLGVQTVNGVLAHGVRTRQTIKAGAIGNDRDFNVVKETWTAPDLHLLVRSINSDPRFGTSTYDLTNIVQAPPDPSLFQTQPPPGYTVRAGWNPISGVK